MMNQQGGDLFGQTRRPQELPELGDIRLEGLTIEEAEGPLEEAGAALYKDPFVILRVQNNRCVHIFPGRQGKPRW